MATKSVEPGEATDRMLTLIVPDGNRAWFYKVVGPITAVDKHADEVIKFVSSIPSAGSAQTPTWKLPEGWTQEAGDSVRLATIKIPSGDNPIELTVNTLAWSGSPEQMLQNINRWRGQLSLPQTSTDALKDDVRVVKGEAGTITIVDLRGQFKGSGMTPPFAAGGGPFSGGAAKGSGARGELPAGHPPVATNGAGPANRGGATTRGDVPAVAAADDEIKFTKPDSWQPVAPSQFRRIGFQIADGSKVALVSVSDFGANSAPMISDPLENVNRWRGEVSMPKIEREDLEKTTERIEIDGHPATFVVLIPESAVDGASTRATLGATTTVGDKIWYFKMSGSRDLVAARRDEFKAFLQSVRFAK